jgi:hypothetical protein
MRSVDPRGDELADTWTVEGYYAGDTLLLVRGDVPSDSLPALEYYLRDGHAVVVDAAGNDGYAPHFAGAPRTTRYYFAGDSVVAVDGKGTRADARRLLSSLAALRAQLAGPGKRVDDSGDTLTARPVAPYAIHGACPFECCHYGEWTVHNDVALRATYAPNAAIVGRVPANTVVRADSGLVLVDTIGVDAVNATVTDVDSGWDFAPGDTVLLLAYQGEGFNQAWLRGHTLSVASFWDETGKSGARLVRPSHELWWAHFTAATRGDTVRGWVHMNDTLRVSGSDACGG